MLKKREKWKAGNKSDVRLDPLHTSTDEWHSHQLTFLCYYYYYYYCYYYYYYFNFTEKKTKKEFRKLPKDPLMQSQDLNPKLSDSQALVLSSLY